MQSKLAVFGDLDTGTQPKITILRSPEATNMWLRPVLTGAGVPVGSVAPRRGLAPSIGILLYLVSVVIIAGMTIAVFFGVAFSLVRQPANALVAEWPVHGRGGNISSLPQRGLSRGGSVGTSGFAASPAAEKALVPSPSLPPAISRPAAKVVTSAPREANAKIPAALHTVDPQIINLLARGDVFLRAGDIASARLFYERAADAGDGQAALQLGATFDPNFLASIGLRTISGDPAKAIFWYHRALGLGARGAQHHLNRLETK